MSKMIIKISCRDCGGDIVIQCSNFNRALVECETCGESSYEDLEAELKKTLRRTFGFDIDVRKANQ